MYGNLITIVPSLRGAVDTFTYDACDQETVRMASYHGNHTLDECTYCWASRNADPNVSYYHAKGLLVKQY